MDGMNYRSGIFFILIKGLCPKQNIYIDFFSLKSYPLEHSRVMPLEGMIDVSF